MASKLGRWPASNPLQTAGAFANLGNLPNLGDRRAKIDISWPEGLARTTVQAAYFKDSWLIVELDPRRLGGDLRLLPTKRTSGSAREFGIYIEGSHLHFKYHSAKGTEKCFEVLSQLKSKLTFHVL